MTATLNRSAQLAAVRQKCRSGEAKLIRETAGVSLSEIAGDIDATATAVWAWENAKRSPTGERALRYARVLARLSSQSAAVG